MNYIKVELIAMVKRLGQRNHKMAEALKTVQAFNPMRNDYDAYLWAVVEWGLGERDQKPAPEDYGIS